MSEGFDSQRLSREKIAYLTQCSIPGCERKVFRYRVAAWHGRPLCRPHYMRNMKYGNPLLGKALLGKPRSVAKRTRDEAWTSLNSWTCRFGRSFSAISAKRLGKSYRKNYIGMPYQAAGPRSDFSVNIIKLSTIMTWQKMGWVRLEERDGEILRFTVVCKSWNGRRMRLP